MKKSMILGILALISVPAFADDEIQQKGNYVGLKLHKNANMAIVGSSNFGASCEAKAGPWGLGANIGGKVSSYARIEGELGYGGGIKVETYGETDTFTTGSAMFNAYLEYEIVKGFTPYIGAGLGLGFLNLDVDAYGYGIKMSESATPLSYQIMLGANIALSERFDVNLGFKYQDYGQLEIEYGAGKMAFDIDSTEFYAGFAYKFDW